MDKIVHYSKMSKTLEKPRKSFLERWEPSQKRAGSVSPTCGGNGACGPSFFRPVPCLQPIFGLFFGQTMEAAFYRPLFGLLRFTADAYNRPNFGQLPCEPSKGFHTEIRRLHDFLHAERIKTAQNGA